MDEADRDTLMRMAAFEHVRRLSEVHDHLTATELKPGFVFDGERIPLINPQRGIFKPQQMRFLLSIKTVFPKPGGKVWYDDQREVHRQIFEGDETIDYAFMGQDPDAADNRWLREAFEHRIPIIYFLGIAPGRYLTRSAIRRASATLFARLARRSAAASRCPARARPGARPGRHRRARSRRTPRAAPWSTPDCTASASAGT